MKSEEVKRAYDEAMAAAEAYLERLEAEAAAKGGAEAQAEDGLE
jgi:hypothetical protein